MTRRAIMVVLTGIGLTLGLVMRLVRRIWSDWRAAVGILTGTLIYILGMGYYFANEMLYQYLAGIVFGCFLVAVGAVLPDLARGVSGGLRRPRTVGALIIGGMGLYLAINPALISLYAGPIISIAVLYFILKWMWKQMP